MTERVSFPVEVETSRGEKFTFNLFIGNDGVWQFDKDEEDAAAEIESDSDRASAIVVGTIVETRLEIALKAHLKNSSIAKKKMFKPSGPLGSFDAKIDLAYLMEIVSKDAYDDLNLIREIRNDFAHDLDIRSFESKRILDFTKQFKLIHTHVGNYSGQDYEPIVGFYARNPRKNPERQAPKRLFVYNYEARKKDPRQRYIMTAQLFTVAFALAKLPRLPFTLI